MKQEQSSEGHAVSTKLRICDAFWKHCHKYVTEKVINVDTNPHNMWLCFQTWHITGTSYLNSNKPVRVLKYLANNQNGKVYTAGVQIFLETYKPPQNSGCQKGDMKVIPCW